MDHENDDLPDVTRKLIHLRASQINGCSVCVDMHSRSPGRPANLTRASSPWRPGETRLTLPTPNGPRCLSPKPSPDSATGRTQCRTRSGTRSPGTTTSRRGGRDPPDRADQRLEPPQCRDQASRGSMGGLSDTGQGGHRYHGAIAHRSIVGATTRSAPGRTTYSTGVDPRSCPSARQGSGCTPSMRTRDAIAATLAE